MDLPNVMRREFSAAKLAWASVLTLQLAAIAAAVLAVVNEGPFGLVALSAGVAVPLTAAAVKCYGGARYERAEQIRRILLQSDGWGRVPPRIEQMLLVQEGSRVPCWDLPPIGSYYTSALPPGPARAADITAQSAFFTAAQARVASIACWVPTVAGAVLGVAALWMVAHGLVTDSPLKAAQVAGVLLAFGFSTEFFSLATAYGSLATAARTTARECAAVAEQGLDADGTTAALRIGEYDAALAKAPPIPGGVYRLQRDALERAWRGNASATTG
jgi:hypothetical protein